MHLFARRLRRASIHEFTNKTPLPSSFPPLYQLRCWDLGQMTLKFQRTLPAEAVDLVTLTDDYSKVRQQNIGQNDRNRLCGGAYGPLVTF